MLKRYFRRSFSSSSGVQIETAIICNEGVVGGWVAIDGGNANTQSTVQIEGSAWQITAAKFVEMYKESDALRAATNRYQSVILFQAQQSAGCHAIHSIESRLCRWLLASQDMIGSDQVTLTQQFLSHMLGVQRTSVSLCAHTPQKSDLIRYSRGRITEHRRRRRGAAEWEIVAHIGIILYHSLVCKPASASI